MRTRMMAALLAAGVVAGVIGAVPAHATEPAAMQIVKIWFDSPGTDNGSNTSLVHEWVEIHNTSNVNRSLTGWMLSDAQSHTYHFGTFTLGAGRYVYIHTGSGTATSVHRYWGSKAYIWNNTGDKATLRNGAGQFVDSCSYTSANDPAKTC